MDFRALKGPARETHGFISKVRSEGNCTRGRSQGGTEGKSSEEESGKKESEIIRKTLVENEVLCQPQTPDKIKPVLFHAPRSHKWARKFGHASFHISDRLFLPSLTTSVIFSGFDRAPKMRKRKKHLTRNIGWKIGHWNFARSLFALCLILVLPVVGLYTMQKKVLA